MSDPNLLANNNKKSLSLGGIATKLCTPLQAGRIMPCDSVLRFIQESVSKLDQ